MSLHGSWVTRCEQCKKEDFLIAEEVAKTIMQPISDEYKPELEYLFKLAIEDKKEQLQKDLSKKPIVEDLKDIRVKPKTLSNLKNDLSKFATEFKLLATDGTLELQRTQFGNVLIESLPPTLRSLSHHVRIDTHFLPPIGDSCKGLLTVLSKTDLEDIQTKKVIGIAEASGAGKTKLIFSMGIDPESPYNVLFIRLYDSKPTAPFKLLIEKLEDEENSSESQKLLAKSSLDLIRLYVVAHFLWLIMVGIENNLCMKDESDSDMIIQRRKCFLQSLRNGNGNNSVKIILNALFDEYKTKGHEWAEDTFRNTIQTASDRYGKFVVAFDEILETSEKFKGIFKHFNDYSAQPNGKIQEETDLFFGFQLMMKELLDFDGILVTMTDTHFTMFDVIETNVKSPLNQRVIPWADLHFFTAADLWKFFKTYFFGSDEYCTDDVTAKLKSFEGRPHHFFVSFLPFLWAICKEYKPKNTEEAAKLFFDSDLFDRGLEHATGVINNILDQKWKQQKGSNIESLDTTLANMKMLYASLYLSNGIVEISTKQNCRDLISCGFLFSQNLADQINKDSSGPWKVNLNSEPICASSLRMIGDRYLRETPLEKDHVMLLLGSSMAHQCSPVTLASKGIVAELLLAWHLLRQCIIANDQGLLLKDALKSILISPWPDRFDKATIHIKRIVDVKGKCGLSQLVSSDDPLSFLAWNIDSKSGTDVALCCKMNLEQQPELGIVAIQSKTGQFELVKAIHTVTPGYQYGDRTSAAKRTKLANVLCETTVQKNWMRVLFCPTKTLFPKFKDFLNEINNGIPEEKEPLCDTQPIVLLGSNHNIFGDLCKFSNSKDSKLGNDTVLKRLSPDILKPYNLSV